jgi:hypothetical protein
MQAMDEMQVTFDGAYQRSADGSNPNFGANLFSCKGA